MAEHDLVLIAGAGPVGLAAAVELTRRGIAVRIIDAGEGPTPADQSRAIAVLPTTLRVFEASGLAERMIAAGTRIEGADFLSGGKPLFSLSLGRARTSYPYILSLPQGRTERLMIDWLEERSIRVEWNVAVEAVGETHRPTARLSTAETVKAHGILGCDGAHSRVREEIGIPWEGEGYPGTFALADVQFAEPIDPHRARISLDSSRPSHALLPLDDRRARLIGFMDSTDALVAAAENIETVIWASTFHVAFRRAERMAKGRVFLAGDAAHVHSPVGGRGMNLGIWDAATIAFLLAEGRESEYESKRLPVIRRIMKQTREATDFIGAPPGYAKALLGIGMPVATRLPFVQRRIAERILALDLPDLEWL